MSMKKPPHPGLAVGDNARRFYYRIGLKLMGVVAAVFVVYVVISAIWGDPTESDSTQATIALRIDLSAIPPGEILERTWQGRPLWVLHRTPEMLGQLEDSAVELYDPSSRWSQQPTAYRNPHRSAEPAYFVVFAQSTDLSCALRWVPADGDNQHAHFVDSCRGSKFDAAGRVWRDQPARRNLVVPDYHIDGHLLLFTR